MARRAPGSIDQRELGRRLRTARERDGISLRQLARRLDLSASAVSQIETGACQPSVRTLYALAAELSLSLDELLDLRPVARRNARVLHMSHRARLELDTGVRWERLTADPDPLLDFLQVTFPPGSSLNAFGRLGGSGGIEMGVILSGELEVTVGASSYLLCAGDSLTLRWDEPHRFANQRPEPVSCVWAILPDGVDQRSLTGLRSFVSAHWSDAPRPDGALGDRATNSSLVTTIPG